MLFVLDYFFVPILPLLYPTFAALLFYLAFVLTTPLYPDGNTVCAFFNLLTVCIMFV